MPLYEFRCPEGHDFERFYRSIGAAPSMEACPECGAVAVRLMSAAGLVFKGSGFYITDYGKDGKKAEREATTKAAAETEKAATAADKASTATEKGADAKSPAEPTADKTAEPAKGKDSKSPAESKPAAPATKPAPSTTKNSE